MGDPALALSFSEKLKMFGGKAYNTIIPEKPGRDNRDLVTRNRSERQRTGSIKSKLAAKLGGSSHSSSQTSPDIVIETAVVPPEDKITPGNSTGNKKSSLFSSSEDSISSDSDTFGTEKEKEKEKGKEPEEKSVFDNDTIDSAGEGLKKRKARRSTSIKKPQSTQALQTPPPSSPTTVVPQADTVALPDDLGWHLLEKEDQELLRQLIAMRIQHKKEREEWRVEKEGYILREKEKNRKLHKEKGRRIRAKKKYEQAKKDAKKGERDTANLDRQLKAKEKEIETLGRANEELEEALEVEQQKSRAMRESERKYKEEINRLNSTLRKVEESLECAICNEDMATVLLLPCKHQALCRTCAGKVEICPICRIHIEERLQTFSHREKDIFHKTFTNSWDITWTTASCTNGN